MFLLHAVTDMYVYAKGNGALGPNVFEPFVPEVALLAVDLQRLVGLLWPCGPFFFFYCMFPVCSFCIQI